MEFFFIANTASQHPVVTGTGGVRKARWSRAGMGKRGGARVIYFFFVSRETVYLFDVYAKSERTDLTEREKKAVRKQIEGIEKRD